MIKAIDNLIQEFSKLPAVGKKSAKRMVLHLLEQSSDNSLALANAITTLKESVVHCSSCHGYSENEICPICLSQKRDKTIICIVEKPMDIFTFENIGGYNGVYHVLGGVISPINGVTPSELNFLSLESRINENSINEVIIGLGGSSEAETTVLYLSRILSKYGIKVTRLARGLPAGSDLEFVDQLTLDQAFKERCSV